MGRLPPFYLTERVAGSTFNQGRSQWSPKMQRDDGKDSNKDPRQDQPAGIGMSAASRIERLREANREFASRPRVGTPGKSATVWKRQSYVLPREEARKAAREFLKKYPRAAYWSEIESWRVLEGDVIEFTMRRLPTAD
jgi:hypothetical protein